MPTKNAIGDNKLNLIVDIFTILMFFIIGAALFFNQGRIGYNDEVLRVYIAGAAIGFMFTLVLIILEVVKIASKKSGLDKIFTLGAVAENPIFKIMRNNLVRLGVVFVWIIFITLTSFSGFQIWGSPDVYTEARGFSTVDSNEPLAVEQFGIARSIFDIGVVPGYTEDMASYGLSVGFAMFILLIVFLIGLVFKTKFFKIGLAWIVVAIIISVPMAALGLNFISGFTQAHEAVGGQNTVFLFAAFLFQTINLYVFWITGLFLPFAHIVHNSIFALGFSFALSIAFMCCMIPNTRMNKWYLNELSQLKNSYRDVKKVLCSRFRSGN